jgi:Uma2 family endonuclease
VITLEQALAEPPPPPLIHYPESDGQPMGENDEQRQWIMKIIANLEALLADRPDVYVSGDLFWYPVEGNNQVVQAPDAMVVFGRPKHRRRCYKQWEENGIPPQVVFEVVSPSNTAEDMIRKLAFYQKYGVEEYYVYDPEEQSCGGWFRAGAGLELIARIDSWRSPRLGITFHLSQEGLELLHPDGRPFAETWEAIRRAEEEHARAEEERARAEEEHARAERLAAKLRALGIDPEPGEVSGRPSGSREP